MSNLPKISIVTPSYNQGKFLRETIESVLNQDYPNLEYFIVDGGSTDNSVEIIREYDDKIDWWVSEKDEGQSDALNKGFNRVTGDYLTWVNSDDVLLPGTLNKVINVLHGNSDIHWISGDVIWIDVEDCIIRCSHLSSYSRILAKMGLLVVGGPSTFFSRSLYESVGGFRKELFFTMDVDLWWRFHNRGYYFYHMPSYLMAFRFHSESKCSSASFISQNKQEKHKLFLLENLKKMERDLLVKKYSKKNLLPFAKLLYRCKQIMNCNYLKACFDLQKMRGRPWQQIFSIDQNPEKQIVNLGSDS